MAAERHVRSSRVPMLIDLTEETEESSIDDDDFDSRVSSVQKALEQLQSPQKKKVESCYLSSESDDDSLLDDCAVWKREDNREKETVRSKLLSSDDEEDDGENVKEQKEVEDDDSTDEDDEIRDKDAAPSDPEHIEFHGAAPVYIRGDTSSYSGAKVLNILGRPHTANVLCHEAPKRVQVNAAFLADLTCVSLDDLEKDDNGMYKHVGSPTHTFTLNCKDGYINSFKKIADKRVEGKNNSFLIRKYRKCGSSTDLRRVISYCKLPSGEVLGNVALIQYNFTGAEHTFQIQPHKNSKNSKEPFYPTKKTTKEILKTKLQEMTPKEAVHQTTRELGGTMNAKSAGTIPRNRKQAYNMNQAHKAASKNRTNNVSGDSDALASLLAMASEERQSHSQNSFIRSIQTHPNPLFVVLASSTQLQNLKAYCTSEIVSSILTVDPTFNIGRFSVTPTTYQDLLLVSKRSGEHPICIGPILLSQNLTKDVYSDFVHSIQKTALV